jgi:hypothetical protein
MTPTALELDLHFPVAGFIPATYVFDFHASFKTWVPGTRPVTGCSFTAGCTSFDDLPVPVANPYGSVMQRP